MDHYYSSPVITNVTFPNFSTVCESLFNSIIYLNYPQCDEYSVSDKVGLQLAGLQAQVIWGKFEPGKEFRYSEANQYLCKRILASSGKNWSQEVVKAHIVSVMLQHIKIIVQK